jgi:hypothetical protein
MSIDRLLRILVTLKLFEIVFMIESQAAAAQVARIARNRPRALRRRVESRRSRRERVRSCTNGEIPLMRCL